MKTLLLPAVLLALVVGEAFAAAPRPNIVLLVADDLGFADVGFNGGKVIATPSLDRLAATGVTLADFRACPMCSPTRAGLLTGRWPLRFGLMRAVVPPWSRYGIPAEEATLPELLATAGYRQRAIVGKWHLGHSRAEQLPLANGFSRFYGHYNGAIDHFTQERDGERDWHDDDRTSRDSGYATDLIGAEVVRLVQRAPTDEPWLVYVPFNAPHAPYQAKAEDLKKYPALEGDRRAYAAMVDAMDQVIGRILAAVEARRDAANTLVLFFSDNGGIPRVGSSNAPYRGAKLGVYEGGTRVAAAMRWPAGGVAGGRKFGGRIGYIDVLPTLLTAAGVPLPRNLDGVNFLPALRGTAVLPERPWFSYIHQNEAAQAAVHLGPWKLVAHGDFFAAQPASRPTLELYQLETDPAEQNDVAAREPGKVAELHRLLREFGTWQMPGVGPYTEGREGFVPPKDWVVGAAPRAANAGDPGRAAKPKRKAGK
jgi:arylsulfatase A-like enzyme